MRTLCRLPAGGAQAKAAEALLEFQFLPRRWYHVVVSHSAGSALAPAWVRLYINGSLEAHERLKYPKVRAPAPACTVPCLRAWQGHHVSVAKTA